MKFFIPDLQGDPEAAEERWQDYVRRSGAPADSRRVFSIEYEHEGSAFHVTVGEPRLEYRRKTGPRGGRRRNAELSTVGRRTGTQVSAIIDAGPILYVWSYGPPFGGWANPSLVGRSPHLSIEYFD